MIDDTLLEAEDKMEKAIEVAKEDLGAIRTGRAQPAMFSQVTVDYYGAPTPIPQLSSISVPEPRMAIIKPYDASQIGVIERAVRDSDLGVNPANDGTVIRVVFPQLTEERRREFVKLARSKGEDAKVSLRNIRRKAVQELQRMQKDGDVGEDDVHRAERALDDLTGKFVSYIDSLMKHKESELLEV